MIRSINIKNDIVAETLAECTNASQLVEVAVLYYLNLLSHDYVEKYKEILEMQKELKKI